MQFYGAKFLKCDLQMQTPADAPHWMGEEFDVANDPENAAEAYIRKCYTEGLEIIAITDHNFKSKDFIPYLQRSAASLAGEFEYELTIFPGFEFTANVGRGVHVLGIFPPNHDLNEIDHILTECGVPRPRQNSDGSHRPSTKSLDEIVRTIQTKNDRGELEGIVILPHSQSDSGIFDNNRIATWLQVAEFKNNNLYALEVPKSPSAMSEGWQKLLGNGIDCDPEWKRERPIACILSSDTKSISDDTRTPHVIGSKYTWMKMSQPSIEALRQCFLDQPSRIRLSDTFPKNPELGYNHPRISSISVQGVAFLADQEIAFSPNLNTLIGGRGTGKSTLLEYMRIVLERSYEIDTEDAGELQKDFEKFKSTLSNSSRLELVYSKGSDFDEPFLIEYHQNKCSVVGEEIGSISAFFPVQIFSRSQIEAMANDPAKQRQILDDPISEQLGALRIREREAISKIQELNTKLREASELGKSEAALTSEIRNLRGKIGSIEKHLGPLKDWFEWKSAKTELDSADDFTKESIEEISDWFSEEDLKFSLITKGKSDAWSVNEEIKEVSKLLGKFASDLIEKAKLAREKLTELQESSSRKTWLDTFGSVELAQASAIKELTEKGIDPDEYDRLQARLKTLLTQLDKVQSELKEIAHGRENIEEILEKNLQPIWNEQFTSRQEVAEILNQNVPKTFDGDPTVKTQVIPFGDFKDFSRTMKPFLLDKRSISENDWATILKAIFDSALNEKIPPSLVLRKWIEESEAGEDVSDFPSSEVNVSKMKIIASWISETSLNEILMQRTLDSVLVTLHRRSDGKEIGDLAGRKLSAGQKATTILSMILAHGESPIIIDQPEDDLDNEFVFDQLVPMLREAKERRQIILATHNANIPVNGDAELIVPLAIFEEEGAQKLIDGILAVGSLDKRSVQQAVELILEGSVEAFKKRQERYGI